MEPRPIDRELVQALCALPLDILPGWLDRPRDELGGRTPLRAIAQGDEEQVLVLAQRLATQPGSAA